MPGRGPIPKDPSQVRRRNKRTVVTVVDDGVRHGPELPEAYQWHEQTVRWWDSLRAAPQASEWTILDWSTLIDTVPLHDAYRREPTPARASELRLLSRASARVLVIVCGSIST